MKEKLIVFTFNLAYGWPQASGRQTGGQSTRSQPHSYQANGAHQRKVAGPGRLELNTF